MKTIKSKIEKIEKTFKKRSTIITKIENLAMVNSLNIDYSCTNTFNENDTLNVWSRDFSRLIVSVILK